MAATRRIQKALVLLLVLGVCAVPLAPASTTQNDAGLGLDVGNTAETAALIRIPGTYSGQLSSNDVDWYRSDVSTSAPLCVSAVTSADPEAAVALETVKNGTTTRAYTRPLTGARGHAALAIPSSATVRVEARATLSGLTGYGFDLATVGVPSTSAGDALSGLDAGATLSSALRVSPGCVGGHLSVVNDVADTRDIYAVSVAAGRQLTYSFAQASAGRVLQVQVLDAAGNVLGPTILSGGAGAFVPSDGGTYYLAVTSSSTSAEDVGYLMGITIGPPEPGSACRPQC